MNEKNYIAVTVNTSIHIILCFWFHYWYADSLFPVSLL